MTDITHLPLSQLRDHPMNANAMSAEMLAKLKRHIEATGRYPPLIVRPMPDEPDAYQIIDGHHRRLVLDQLGRAEAACVVWAVDDRQTLMLLATLNRLEGGDDPKRRAAIIRTLTEGGRRAVDQLARFMPESADRLERYAKLTDRPPEPAPPPALADMPAALTFYLTVDDRRRVVAALDAIDPKPEQALLRLIAAQEPEAQ